MSFSHSVESGVDARLTGAHLTLSKIHQDTISGTIKGHHVMHAGKPFDIYHDANPSEATKCRPLLEELTTKVDKLMEEWPDHPALKHVRFRKHSIDSECPVFLSYPIKSTNVLFFVLHPSIDEYVIFKGFLYSMTCSTFSLTYHAIHIIYCITCPLLTLSLWTVAAWMSLENLSLFIMSTNISCII